jgi:hypothetical protein
MKKLLTVIGAAIIALHGFAQVPTYTTLHASGRSTSVVLFASSPGQQLRVVQAIASSDLASANLTLKTGATPLTVAYTNPAAAKQIGVSSTNGFATGDYLILETASGLVTNAQITGFGAATNITLASQVYPTVPGDQVYKLGSATTLFVGTATNRTFSSEAVFVGNRGRPVQAIVNGTSACSLDAVSARYE